MLTIPAGGGMEKKTVLFYGLLVVGLLLLAFMFVRSGLPQNLDIFREVNPGLLVLALLMTCANVIVKIYRWKYLCGSYGKDIAFGESGKIVISSFFVGGITPAKIGDLIKAYIMKRRHGLPLTDGIFSIMYERAFELFTLFFVSLGLFYLGLSAKNYIFIQLASFLLILLVIAYFFSDRLLLWAQGFLIRTKVVNLEGENPRIRKLAPARTLVVFLLTGLALGLEFVRLWLVCLAFGYPLYITHLSVFFSLAALIGALSQIPIGLGVVEGSLALFLTDAGIPSYYAFGIVLLDRALSMYFVAFIGLFYYKWALKSAMEAPG
jgi:uncharacterized membrane protein YbhN (UPF0104 family)